MVALLSRDDLHDLPRDRRVNGLVARERVAVAIADLPRHEQLRWERALNRYQSRCGCPTGALSLIASLWLGGVWLTDSFTTVSALGFAGRVLVVLAAATLAATLGKFLALQVTRWQFARTCRRLSKISMSDRSGVAAEGGGSTCPGAPSGSTVA